MKWLLNERAAILGGISRSLGSLEAKEARCRAKLAKLAKERAVEEASLQEERRTVAALDTVIGAEYPAVAPDAAGIVRPHEVLYGGRGQLTATILRFLQQAGPQGLRISVLTYTLQEHFQLEHRTWAQHHRFYNSVRSTLRRLNKTTGEVVKVPGSIGAVWRCPGPITLAELKAQANERANTDASAPEVAHQRDGGHAG